jgi:hypothetical protein
MFVCTTILYEYINLLDIYNLFANTHVRIKIYREFYHVLFILTMKYVVLEYIDKNLLISYVLAVLSIYFYNHQIKHYR